MTLRRTRAGHPFALHPKADAPWVVFTHGAFLDHSDFDGIVAALGQSWSVLAWDLPGHGASTARPATRLDGVAEALRDVMDEAGIARAIHVGFSFGGMSAQRFVRLYPARAVALVAYGCTPITLIERPAPPELLWPHVRTAMNAMPWPEFARDFASQASPDAAHADAFRRRIEAQTPALRDAIWEAMIYGSSWEPDFWPACPVGQIVGEWDDRFPGAAALFEALAARLPDDLRFTIPGAGHLTHTERPAEFLRALQTLLERLQAAAHV